MSNLFESGGAEFSEDRKYRYALWRIWDPSKPLVMFIGLNPSTANETKSDPTINRVCGLAKNWGMGGIYMMNLFALVTPYPKELLKDPDPLGQNDGWLEKISPLCSRVIFAWGKFKAAEERAKVVTAMFPEAEALHINKNGSPKHPLYVAKHTIPIKFK